MRIRFTGTRDECVAAAAIVSAVLDVTAESAECFGLGASAVVQVHLTADVLARPERANEQGEQSS